MTQEAKQYRDPWWARHPFAALAVAAVVLVILCGGAWVAKVALSPVKGAGDVIIEQNDADNMINAQRELQQRYNGLGAACRKIDVAKAALDADPDSYTAKANHTSTRLHYENLVAEYNALTQQLLAKNMLGGLPQRVNPDNCDGVTR